MRLPLDGAELLRAERTPLGPEAPRAEDVTVEAGHAVVRCAETPLFLWLRDR